MKEEHKLRVLNALKNFAFRVICYSIRLIFLLLCIALFIWPIIAVFSTENPYWFFGYFISFLVGLGIEFLRELIFGIDEEDEDFDLI